MTMSAATVELSLERGGQQHHGETADHRSARHHPGRRTFSSAMECSTTLSYQLARQFNVPVKGVYVANPGYAFGAAGIARGSVIVAMNAKPVNDLDDLQKILDTLGDGARATVRYFSLDDPHSTQLRSFRMDRRWFLAGRCRRDDHVGLWNCADLPPWRRRRRRRPHPRAAGLSGSAAEEAHAVTGVRHLRHAVLGLRRHRDQLPRHRPGGRCGARPGGRGSQYRAGLGRATCRSPSPAPSRCPDTWCT